jgi:hypothetical protein
MASVPFLEGRFFLVHWVSSWMVAWIMMTPIVLLAAPVIRNLTYFLNTRRKNLTFEPCLQPEMTK